MDKTFHHTVSAFKCAQGCAFETEEPEKEREVAKGTFDSKGFELLSFVRGEVRSAYEILIRQNQALENEKGVVSSFLHFSERERCTWL